MNARSTFRNLLFRGATGLVALCLVSEASAQLDEIVVTARKREENKLDIPISVSAFSQDELDAAGVNSFDTLGEITPGMQFQNAGPGGNGGRASTTLRIRGLGPIAPSPSTRSAAVFWDGGYMSDGLGLLPLIDLERVEVIKGPQTAFFGRNTFTGAVNFIPKSPGDEFEGRISASYGPSLDNSYNFTAAFGGPITDTFGVRVAVMKERVGADWEFSNGDPNGREDTTSGTIVAEWEASDRVRLKFSGLYVEAEDTGIPQSQTANVAPGDCNVTYNGSFLNVLTGTRRPFSTDLSLGNRSLFCGNIPDYDDLSPNASASGSSSNFPAFRQINVDRAPALPTELEGRDWLSFPDHFGTDYELWRTNLSLEADLPGEHTLSMQYAHGDNRYRQLVDGFYGDRDTMLIRQSGRVTQEDYYEIRLASPSTNRLRYMFGASLYDQENSFGLNGFIAWSVNLQEVQNFGVFAALDYDLTDQLTLSVEGRWHDDELTSVYEGAGEGLANNAGIINESQAYTKFMPRVILSYKPTETTNLYGSVSTSYLNGTISQAERFLLNTGINLGLDTFTPPQEMVALELGFKQALGERFEYSVAVYQMDWKNQVFFENVAVGNPPQFFGTAQPGDAEYFGIDFEFQARPLDWLRMSGGVSYNDADLKRFASGGSIAAILSAGQVPVDGEVNDVSGNRIRYIAEWTGSVSTTIDVDQIIDLPLPVWFRLDSIYQGDFYTNNFEWQNIDGFWEFNARLGAQINDRISLEFYGDNISNDLSHNTTGGTTGGPFVGGIPTRKTFAPNPDKVEWGIRVTADF